ncbi:angiopoietin-4-like [Ochlerotatus camptorhynchus]|uniref:angiopoietin-4-like n=1 Tax=Ochlerotatus camptorhynchus TaxID=644619 RepID=UPI0031E268E8
MWTAVLFTLIATAWAQSDSESRPITFQTAPQCDCSAIQTKLDQQDQRVLFMFNLLQNGHSKALDKLDHRVTQMLDQLQNAHATELNQLKLSISEMFDLQQSKTESIHNDYFTKMDKVEHRVLRMVSHHQKETESIFSGLMQIIENDDGKDLVQDNLTEQSVSQAVSDRHLSVVNNVKVQYVDTPFGSNWIVILQRTNGSVCFARPWKEYRNGFGTVGREYWFGLENMHQLTKDTPYELVVEMTALNSDEKRYARYDRFEIGSEDQQYPLVKLGLHSGSAGDGLSHHRFVSFSTYDSGAYSKTSNSYGCGGWWFDGSFDSYLTGEWGATSWSGIWWGKFKTGESWTSLKTVRMMIRAI